MQTLQKQLKRNLALISFGLLFVASSSLNAATDLTAQQKFLEAKSRGGNKEMEDHSQHLSPIQFHGVFYGFLPCDKCNGIKTTLSLKNNDNYLIVTQQAKESSREMFEKGKYVWDEENMQVRLTPKNHEATTRLYRIKDEGTLIQLNDDGTEVKGADAERYYLRRSDTVQTREVHIH
ncbi:MAG: copper resistance protein NlpE [Methylococcales bacterium]|nr:copper resistance protein NlpE [Methylococcales bacterium]